MIPYNRKEIYGLIRNTIYPRKASKMMSKKPFFKKHACVSRKLEYWKIVANENVKRGKRAEKNWANLVEMKLKLQKKIIEKRLFILDFRNRAYETLFRIKKVLMKKIVKPANELLAKEMKEKRKKLRRK
jgi:hypothetical protein